MFQCLVLAVTAVLIGLDQLTKWLAVTYLKNGESVTAIPGVLEFSYVENEGAAFGMLQGGRWFLVALTTILITALAVFVLTGRFRRYKLFTVSGTLIIAGGIGNLIDRSIQGYVVDFLKVTFMNFPVFNLADCCVVVGSVLLLIFFCFFYEEQPATEGAYATDSTDNPPRG